MRSFVLTVGSVLTLAAASPAAATPAEPTGAHPRMLLDAELKAAWRAEAKANRGPVKTALALCASARDSAAHDRAVYQGSEWAKILQACLVAWAATDDPSFAKTGVRFFTALLDDLDRIGDGLGGDAAAIRDKGYAIRNLGPYTALAYDWFHALIPPATRERAVQRWSAWLDAYVEKGYRARVPGTNYQAGFLLAATAIAIAQGGEAGEGGGARWAFVADELWGKDMAGAFAQGGILEGGDWPEGWQYGPLAVASYSLAARLAARAGIEVAGVDAWLAAMLRRHVHALSPGDGVYAGGDTEAERATLPPNMLTLAAIALGDAPAPERAWAKGELARLSMLDADYPLYGALATIGAPPAQVPRATWPTAYVAPATGTLYARTRWDASAMWLVAECQRTLDVDHRHPNAGNFVLSRGRDDLIVDPTPYGSRSTLTGNAPTVVSAQLPASYQPSQGYWGAATAWAWTAQTRSGVVAARCDYRDQYRFQERPSDVAAATRDFVLVPTTDGTDGTLVVIDRATTGDARRSMHLRFRTPAPLALAGSTARATIGGTALAITTLAGGAPTLGGFEGKDCFQDESRKGRCDAARFPVHDVRLEVPGPTPAAIHTIAATPAGAPTPNAAGAPTPIRGDGWHGARLGGAREAVIVWPEVARPAALAYRVPVGAAVTHVVLDAPQAGGKATIAASLDGDACAVTIAAGGDAPAQPAVFTLDRTCALAVDPPTLAAASAASTSAPLPPARRASRGSGCCGTTSSPASSLAFALGVGLVLVRRRGRRDRAPARAGS